MSRNAFSIDRTAALEAFKRYVGPYDMDDPKIALKAAHTLRVAAVSERIARASGFTQAGIDLAWLCGLLHDLGRFEQLRRWGTFNDALSAKHAAIGVDILFNEARSLTDPAFANRPADEASVRAADGSFVAHARATGSVRSFLPEGWPEADALVRAAVAHHSDYRLPAALDARTRAFCDLVRDADKIDILRVDATDEVQTVLGCTEEQLLRSSVSESMERAFFEHRTATRGERSTPADHLVNLACFAYELAYPASIGIMVEQGYIYRLFSRPFGITRPFTDKATARLLAQMDGHLRAWIDERIEG